MGVNAVPQPITGQIDVTQETIDLVRRVREAEQQRAITLGTGLIGYDLATPAQVVVPVFTPVVNSTPRVAGVGIDIHHFKSITSFGWEQAGPGSPAIPGVVDENQNPSQPVYNIASLYNIFQTLGVANEVSFKAQWRGRSLEGDIRAKRMAELLYILKLIEEQWFIYYSDYLWVLPAPLQPTANAAGGTLAAATYFVGVTARSANGETPVSIAGTANGAAAVGIAVVLNGSITFTLFTEPLASGYNVYLGTATNNLLLVAAANLQVNGVVQTGNPATTGAIPQAIPNLFGSITVTITAAGASTNPPAANGAIVSKGANNLPLTFNGLLGLIFSAGNLDYTGGNPNAAPTAAFTAAGQSTNNITRLGETTMIPLVIQPAASTGKLAYTDITNMFLFMYMQARANPDVIGVSPQDNNDVTNLLVNAAGARVNISAMIPDALGNLTLGQRVTQILNPTTGKVVQIEVWPFLPQGTMIFKSNTLPYPVPGFDGPILKALINQDYYGVDYPPTAAAPKFSWADYIDETLEISFLGGFGAITGMIP